MAADDAQENSVALPLCGIAEARSGTQLLVHGIAFAEGRAAVRYRLRVTKIGTGGTSDIAQAGEVRLEPGTRLNVGQVGISLEEGARYDAVLTLSVEGHSVECRASGPRARSTPL